MKIQIAFSHPDLFSKAGGHSPAMFTGDTSSLSWLYPTEEIRSHSDPILLAKANDITSLSIYLDHASGDMDHVIDTTNELYDILKDKHADVQIHMAKGSHDSRYWKSQIDNYLEFYGSVKVENTSN